MAKTMFVADDQMVVTIPGIRWVKKSDYSYPTSKFAITVKYSKDDELRVDYDDKASRDTIFNLVVGAMLDYYGREKVTQEETVKVE
jgi:hypothetical protein